MRALMLSLAALVALPFASVSGTMPLDAAHWEDRNPLGGDFHGGKYECLLAGNNWNVRAKSVPVSSNVVVSAEFTPTATDGDSFKTAAVALYEAPRRMWHLALLDTPAPSIASERRYVSPSFQEPRSSLTSTVFGSSAHHVPFRSSCISKRRRLFGAGVSRRARCHIRRGAS